MPLGISCNLLTVLAAFDGYHRLPSREGTPSAFRCAAMAVRIKGDEIWFDEWGDDLKAFLRQVESALGVKAKKRRLLVFMVRYDFVIDGESVLLAVDEDGTAYIGLGKNSASVKQKVIDRIRRSGAFEEQR